MGKSTISTGPWLQVRKLFEFTRPGSVDDTGNKFHISPSFNPCRMGPPVDSVQLPYFSGFMVDMTMVNRGYFMVSKPIFTSLGGPILCQWHQKFPSVCASEQRCIVL